MHGKIDRNHGKINWNQIMDNSMKTMEKWWKLWVNQWTPWKNRLKPWNPPAEQVLWWASSGRSGLHASGHRSQNWLEEDSWVGCQSGLKLGPPSCSPSACWLNPALGTWHNLTYQGRDPNPWLREAKIDEQCKWQILAPRFNKVEVLAPKCSK